MADSSKGTPCRNFVRVRPFTEKEATICPMDCPVPREVVTWDGKHTITILDPQDGFLPRKNGTFNPVDVLWGFQDDEGKQQKLSKQKDVYDTVVRPNIKSIVEGYNAAFCVAGASNSGRFYTLYGDSVDGPNRGILPRFAEDIFEAFDKQRQDNSTICAEVEAVDISGESYVDLLAIRRRRAGSVSANGFSGDDTLKLQNGRDGTRLTGVTTVELKGVADFRVILKQLLRTTSTRNCTHTVSIRLTETFEFNDTDQGGQSICKSRRVHVLFVLLRNMPAAFQRIIDIAVEHDSGENPLAKVPTREAALTKLFPDLFQQGYHLNIISCVSPYYEHVREDMNTMQFCMKVRKLRGKPKLNQDESLVEMRRLADEVKGLKVEARNQSHAMKFIQKELNAREVELMKQEAEHNQVKQEIAETEKAIAEGSSKRKAQMASMKEEGARMEAELERERLQMREVQDTKATKKTAVEQKMRAADDAKVRTESFEKKIIKQRKNTCIYEQRLKEYEQDEKALKALEEANLDPPEVHERRILAQSDLHVPSEAELAKVKAEKQVFLPLCADTDKRYTLAKAEYEKAIAAEEPSRQCAVLEEEIAKLEKEIADVQAETRRLQAEIDQKKSECSCRLM